MSRPMELFLAPHETYPSQRPVMTLFTSKVEYIEFAYDCVSMESSSFFFVFFTFDKAKLPFKYLYSMPAI